jgi:RNA 3'-terminal phosphate cyclase (ATP)
MMTMTKTGGAVLTIDGALGEGGGQILRTALALSLATGAPFRIERIRANRSRPGLLRQHLTALNAATAIGEAEVTGAEIGSSTITFAPRAVRPGTYRFAVGTAGSTTLVLQTVLPALMIASAPSELVLEGGTHNPMAPPFDFLQKAFLPLIARMGPRVEMTLERPGFYPAGGGRFSVRIDPVSRAALRPFTLVERGEIQNRHATAWIANLDSRIGTRELSLVQQKLGWPEEAIEVRQVTDSPGPGNVLLIELHYEHVTEVFSGFGEKGVRAEAVADGVVDQVRRYLVSKAPVGPYLADQLLLPLALSGGGSFLTQALSRHATTNIDVIRQFLPVPIATEADADGRVLVRIGA